MVRNEHSKYILIGLFFVLIVLVFLIIRPFISTILASLLFAYIFYPLYKIAYRFVRNENVASLIVIIIIVLIFIIPTAFIANSIIQQGKTAIVFVEQVMTMANSPPSECNEIACRTAILIRDYIRNPEVQFYIKNIMIKFIEYISDRAGDFILSVPNFIMHFFIMLFIIFYLLKEGNSIIYKIKKLIPLKKTHTEDIFEKLNDVTSAVIYGHLLTSFIQAILGVIAFYTFGIKSFILWAVIMFFFAIIPFLGTPIVWVPMVVVKFFSNEPGNAIGLLISGIFISIIDNLIRPKIVSGKAKVHPVVILLGVIGGLIYFGPVGIIAGPVILTIFLTVIRIYEGEKIEA